MNEALEQLLTTRAILNSHRRELAQSANIARHQNENQAAEAIKEVEVQCATAIRGAEATIKEAETHYEVAIKEAETQCPTQAYDLEQSHQESVLKLEHEALAEEGHDHQAFVEACSTALWACPLKAHGVTNVSPVAPYWQCATGHHAGYHPTTGHSGQRTAI